VPFLSLFSVDPVDEKSRGDLVSLRDENLYGVDHDLSESEPLMFQSYRLKGQALPVLFQLWLKQLHHLSPEAQSHL